jgi:type III pantothenate kinase
MILYFDVGNTHTKLNYQFKNKNYYQSFYTKKKYSIDTIYNLLPNIVKKNKITKILISSTVPSFTFIVERLCQKYFMIKPIILSIKNSKLDIKIENPKELGIDLIALGHYLMSKTDNGIMVNMGTSTTIIHVKNKKFIGAIISCGLELQIKYLIKNASKLYEIELFAETKKTIGKNTKEAMSLGLINGHVEMIKGLVNKIDINAKKFLSGGYSKNVVKLLKNYN